MDWGRTGYLWGQNLDNINIMAIIMKEEEIHNKTCQYPETIEELVDAMEKHPDSYHHLKVFLRRDGVTDLPEFGEEYLVVSSSGFGLYKINAVDYQNGRIILTLIEVSTNKEVHYSLNLTDPHPSCIFIRWKDVKNMVFDECMTSNVNDNDLLELIG